MISCNCNSLYSCLATFPSNYVNRLSQCYLATAFPSLEETNQFFPAHVAAKMLSAILYVPHNFQISAYLSPPYYVTLFSQLYTSFLFKMTGELIMQPPYLLTTLSSSFHSGPKVLIIIYIKL